jgi:hypothetical protein
VQAAEEAPAQAVGAEEEAAGEGVCAFELSATGAPIQGRAACSRRRRERPAW